MSTAGGLLATVSGMTKSTPEVTKEENKVIPTSSVETNSPDASATSSSITASSTSSMLSSGEGQSGASDTTNEEEATVIDGSENNQGGHSDKDVSRKGEDLDANLSNKSLELEEDSLVAAAEGEERTSDVEAIAPSIPITASGEGSVGASAGISDPLENIDVHNPGSYR